jgi:hypothetical protein
VPKWTKVDFDSIYVITISRTGNPAKATFAHQHEDLDRQPDTCPRAWGHPAAMPAVAKLTFPFCTKHPHVTVDVKSMTSVQIQTSLDKFELDAGLTYLENEPLSNVRQKRLITNVTCSSLTSTARLPGRKRSPGALQLARNFVYFTKACSIAGCLINLRKRWG